MAAIASKIHADRGIIDTFLLSQFKYIRTSICGKNIGGAKPSEPACSVSLVRGPLVVIVYFLI
jgi:hypothetical protein